MFATYLQVYTKIYTKICYNKVVSKCLFTLRNHYFYYTYIYHQIKGWFTLWFYKHYLDAASGYGLQVYTTKQMPTAGERVCQLS